MLDKTGEPSILLCVSSTKYLLIPSNGCASSGDLSTRSLDGTEMLVDSTSTAAFEVTQEEAKTHLQAEWEGALKQVRQAFANLMAFEAQTKQEEPSEQSSPPEEPSGRRVIAALLGLTPEELEQHPERTEEALPELLDGLGRAFKAVFSGDEAQVEAARQNIETLQDRLEAQGISTKATGTVAEAPSQETDATAERKKAEAQEDVSWWRQADARLLQATEAWNTSNREHLNHIAEELKAVLTAEMKKGAEAEESLTRTEIPAGEADQTG